VSGKRDEAEELAIELTAKHIRQQQEAKERQAARKAGHGGHEAEPAGKYKRGKKKR
jgi:hypothetical protein